MSEASFENVSGPRIGPRRKLFRRWFCFLLGQAGCISVAAWTQLKVTFYYWGIHDGSDVQYHFGTSFGASEHIVLEFFKHLLCPSGAIHHWSVIAYPTNFVTRAAPGACYGQISWQAQHLEHVMIALMWPAQHLQQLRIISRGRRSTWSTLWFFVWPAQHFQQLRIISRGRRSTWSTLWSKSGTRL